MDKTLNLYEGRWKRRELRKFKKQRIERGFADSDWWSMDHYLLLLIPAMLETFMQQSKGVVADGSPCFDDDNIPMEELLAARNDILKQMITHFKCATEALEKSWAADYAHNMEIADTEMKLGFDLLKEHIWKLWY